MIKIYAEIGYGNASFCNTEIERGEFEHRVAKFILPPRVEGVYIRIWFRQKVYVLSSKNGLSVTLKSKNRLKLLFGVEGSRE